MTIAGNIVTSNTSINGGGGGIWIGDYSTTIIDGNDISSNKAGGGGGIAIANGSTVTITNNVIDLNMGVLETWQGDGVVVWGDDDSDVRIINNTIVSNIAEGIQADAGTVLARNNVIYGNDGGIHNYQSGALVSSDHNAFWNNGWNYGNVMPGIGDISEDPLFVDIVNEDYHLQADSPCIDAGTSIGAPSIDIEGTSRDAKPDIGAYEWGKYHIFLPLTLRSAGQ